jgi:hypothetical protein
MADFDISDVEPSGSATTTALLQFFVIILRIYLYRPEPVKTSLSAFTGYRKIARKPRSIVTGVNSMYLLVSSYEFLTLT